jgi:hypothetical protein
VQGKQRSNIYCKSHCGKKWGNNGTSKAGRNKAKTIQTMRKRQTLQKLMTRPKTNKNVAEKEKAEKARRRRLAQATFAE